MPRSRQRGWCGWLGLLALALQLVLSFAHIHHHEITATATMAAASLEPGSAGQSPADPDDDGDRHCSICWAVAVAAGIVLATVAAWAFVSRRVTAPLPGPAQAPASSCLSHLFQARAPPSPASA